MSTSIVSRASQGVSEAALELRGCQRDARRAALFLKAAQCLSITSLWIAIAGWLSGIELYDIVRRLSVTAGAVVRMSQALRLRRYAYSALFGISRVALQSYSADHEFFWRMAARCLACKRGPVCRVTGLGECTDGLRG